MPKFGKLFISKTLNPEAMMYDAVARSWEFIDPRVPVAHNGSAWSPLGDYLAMASNSGLVFRIADSSSYTTSTWASTPSGACWGVDFSPAGDRVAAVFTNSPRLRVWDTATKAVIAGTPTLPETADSVSYNRDGTRLAVTYGSSSNLRIYDTATWAEVAGFPATGVFKAAFSRSATGEVLAALTSTGIKFYDGQTGALRADLPTISTISYAFAWSPDGKRLAVGDESSPPLRILDVDLKALLSGVYNPGMVGVQAVAWSPDGRLAISITNGGGIVASTLDVLESNLAPINSAPVSMAWAPAPPYTISGKVLNAAEAPAARGLYAVHDVSRVVVGRAISDALTGAYSIATPYADGHTVVLEEEGGRAQVIGMGIIPL